MGEKRVTMQVDLPPDLQESLREFCRRSGRIQKEVVSQVLRWFLSQQGVVRRVALNDVDAGMEVNYAEALEELARQVRAAGEKSGQSEMLEHDDIDAPPQDEEPVPVKQREPPRTIPRGKSGRRTGTPLPRARAVADQVEPAR